MSRFPMLSLLLLAALWLPAPARAACTEITELPATISAPGNYCMTGTLAISGLANHAITIAADKVTLDCGGAFIRYTGSPVTTNTTAAIYVPHRRHVTIRNCGIEGGFGIGIHVAQDNAAGYNANHHVTIEDNFIERTHWYGILANGTGTRITGNRVFDVGERYNSFSMGIRVGSATGPGNQHVVEVRDNFVSGTYSYVGSYAAYGIYSENGVNGSFTGNTVTGTSGAYTWGIRLGGNNNLVARNQIHGSNKPNDVGIQSNSATDACYDNHIRATTKTAVCNATLGNY